MMPVQRCVINGERGWKWGKQGKCYPGPNGKKKAIAQGVAIGDIGNYKEGGEKMEEKITDLSNKEVNDSNALMFASLEMPIFSTGKWNGDTYTDKDLSKIVEAYNSTKDQIKPYLKLGHNKTQDLAKNSGLFKDGMPAMGWLDNLKKVGGQLVASFRDVPNVIADLVKKKAYRTVSSELYIDYEHNNSKYPFLLKAVALLGADMPAVTNLQDVVALYQEDDSHETKVIEFQQENKEEVDVMSPEEKELMELKFKEEKTELVKEYNQKIVDASKEAKEELEKKFSEEKAELEKKFSEDIEKVKSETIAEFAEQKKKVEELLEIFKGEGDVISVAKELIAQKKDTVEKAKLYTETLEKAKREEIANFVEDKISKNQMLPIQREIAKQILFHIGEDATEITFTKSKEYGIEEKKALGEAIKEFMSLYPDMGLLKEFASTKGEKQYSSKEDEFEALVAQYQKDNPEVKFGDAQIAVSKMRPELLENKE